MKSVKNMLSGLFGGGGKTVMPAVSAPVAQAAQAAETATTSDTASSTPLVRNQERVKTFLNRVLNFNSMTGGGM